MSVPEADVHPEGFRRQLSWRDGFAIALLVPVAIFASLGPSIAVLGTLGVIALMAVSGIVGFLQNFLYSELAGMFPNKAGGLAIYAHEGLRKYCSPLGAITAFGYWAGWAFGAALMALAFGSVVHVQFFPDVTWTVPIGSVDASLSHVIAVLALLFVSWLNLRGIRFSALLAKVLGGFAAVLIILFVLGPVLVGVFNTDGLTWQIPDGIEGWHVAIVFLFLFAGTAYGTEVCATFTPEYKDPRRDTPRALYLAAVVAVGAATLTPLGIGGTLGDEAIMASPGTIYTTAFAEIVGPASALVSILLAASFLLVMNGGTADAGRALYGIAHAGMSVKQLDKLNKNREPARAVLVALVANIALVLLVGNPLGIMFAAQVGYVLANLMAIIAFVLLRRDRPSWPRMIKLSAVWVPIAVVLAIYNALILTVGALSPEIAGFGGLPQQLIGIGVLLLGLILLLVRRLLQDKQPVVLRDKVDATPNA